MMTASYQDGGENRNEGGRGREVTLTRRQVCQGLYTSLLAHRPRCRGATA